MNKVTIEELREEAAGLGIEFHPNTGEAKLTAMINDFKEGDTSDPEPDEKDEKVETTAERHARLRREQTKLIRIILRCNNDKKKELKGDFFTVANKIVGTYTKFVPFDNEEGFHIPQAMLDTLNDKMCQKWKKAKVNGVQMNVPYMTKEFTIEILPSLTQEELDKLADEQKIKGSID